MYQQYRQQHMIADNRKFIPPYEIIEPPVVVEQPPFSTTQPFSANPKDWGPSLWYYLHTAAYNYPSQPTHQEVKSMKNWLKCLHVTIPCKNCSQHYKKYIDKYDKHLEDICKSRTRLFEFFVDIHNQVNQRNGKPIVDYDKAYQMYKQ